MKKPENFVIKNYSKAEIQNQRLNYNKIKRELKWKPKFNLKLSIIKTINWYKNNLNKL